MKEKKILKDVRKSDPYVDRRSGEDRRQVYDADYFQNGGLERMIVALEKIDGRFMTQIIFKMVD
jgi:hypothetical protein